MSERSECYPLKDLKKKKDNLRLNANVWVWNGDSDHTLTPILKGFYRKVLWHIMSGASVYKRLFKNNGDYKYLRNNMF